MNVVASDIVRDLDMTPMSGAEAAGVSNALPKVQPSNLGILPAPSPVVPLAGEEYGASPLSTPFLSEIPTPVSRKVPTALDKAMLARENIVTSASLRKFGAIAKQFPGAEKIRIRVWEDDVAQWAPCGDWQFRSIQALGDIEAFLVQHVGPKFGFGRRYNFSIIDAALREHSGGEIKLPTQSPSAEGTSAGNESVAMALIRRLDSHGAPAAIPVDPIENYKKMKAALAAEGGGGGGQELLMTTMMQMQQQSQDRLLELVIGQQRSQETAALKAELESLKAAMAIPPPAPVSSEPSATDKVLQVLLERALAPQPSLIEQLKVLKEITAPAAPAKNEFEMFREHMTFFRELNGAQKQDTLVDQLKALQAVKEVAQDIVGAPEPVNDGGINSFWGAVASLFSNDSFANGLGKLLGDEVNKRRAPARVEALPPGAPAANKQLPAPSQIDLPPNWKALCKSIEDAGDNHQGLVASTAQALWALRKLPQWSKFVDGLLALTSQNEREKAMAALENWLRMMATQKHLTPQTAANVYNAFVAMWDPFVSIVRQQMGLGPLPLPAAPEPSPAPTPMAVATPSSAPPSPPADVSPTPAVASMPSLAPADPAPATTPENDSAGDDEEDDEGDESEEGDEGE